MDYKDDRRLRKFNKTKKHFSKGKYQPKTKRDIIPPQRPLQDSSHNCRRVNKEIAKETIEILEKGYYKFEGQRVDLSKDLSLAVKNTVTYPPDSPIKINFDPRITNYKVLLESTLNSCHRMVTKGSVCALNFASAKHPGGGFLKGSSAQEESIARASGLYKCIQDSEMYKFNFQDNNKCLYSNYMIYSPNVPIFRDEYDELLLEPFRVSFITSPAVNTREALKRGVNKSEIREVMIERIDRLLTIAVYHQHDILILGSWGCGVFGGDIYDVGRWFREHLTKKFYGAFKKVLFSTLSEDDHNILNRIFDL